MNGTVDFTISFHGLGLDGFLFSGRAGLRCSSHGGLTLKLLHLSTFCAVELFLGKQISVRSLFQAFRELVAFAGDSLTLNDMGLFCRKKCSQPFLQTLNLGRGARKSAKDILNSCLDL